MLVILKQTPWQDYQETLATLQKLSNSQFRLLPGKHNTSEFYFLNTPQVTENDLYMLPCVTQINELFQPFPLLQRIETQERYGFDYQGTSFGQDNLTIFAGLNAVDNKKNIELVFAKLKQLGLNCARMGAYKPRTSPYNFQGLGARCLTDVFELAGKYDIRIIAMEVTHDSQLHEIDRALAETGYPTGVMLQIGTRNSQNYELLKHVGAQQQFPVLYKRGYGITLTESMMATEYLAAAGNRNIIFCLRGIKGFSHEGHRNMVDVAHVPMIKRLTRMPVGMDPSHSVGSKDSDFNGFTDIEHVTCQAVIAGANLLLIDIHPEPNTALVDSAQALTFAEMEKLLPQINICHQAYQQRIALTD